MSKPRVELIALSPSDAQLVGCWLGAEHVRRYWGDPERSAAELDTLPPDSQVRLIEAGGRRVGLVVWQHPTRRELDEAGLFEIPAEVVDIDIMIGEVEQTGRGIGPAAIRLVVEQVLSDQTVPFVMAATRLDNRASRRAFARAGFREEREFDDPGNGRAVLMALRR